MTTAKATRRIGALLGALVAAGALLALAGAASASAAPVLHVQMTRVPASHPVPAGTHAKYLFNVSNTGDEYVEAPLAFEFHAPAGLEIVEAKAREYFSLPSWECTTPDAQTAICNNGIFFFTGPGQYVCQELEEGPCPIEIMMKSESSASPATLTSSFEVCGGAEVACVNGSDELEIGPPLQFGVQSFDGGVFKQDGEPVTQAGGHPFTAATTFMLNAGVGASGEEYSAQALKDAIVKLPPGLTGNPQAVAQCPAHLLIGGLGGNCPPETQVGRVGVIFNGPYTPGGKTNISGGTEILEAPVYNLTPSPGTPAVFGFNILETVIHVYATVRTGDDYGVTLFAKNAAETLPFGGIEFTFWGVPADPGHETERETAFRGQQFLPPGTPLKPFLSLPTSCAGPGENNSVFTELTLTGWQGGEGSLGFFSHDNEGNPIGATGCNALDFSPSLEARPTTNVADAPSGLDVDLHIPQPPAEVNTEGEPYTCSSGDWSNNPTGFAYQWLRNGVPIGGATANTYTPQAADTGAVLQCQVAATNAATGSSLVATLPFYAQPAPSVQDPVNSSRPKVKGKVEASGGELTCSVGSWKGQPSFAYQWFKNGSSLAGQSKETLTLGVGETPATFQCEVLATNAGGTTVSFSNDVATTPAADPALADNVKLPITFLPESAYPLATAHLRKTVVTLPEGLVVNPSSANGLAGCSPAQIGFTNVVAGVVHTTPDPATCPDASKLGTVEVDTPLLDHPLKGAVYIATPYDNPFESLIALYIAVDDPVSGIVIKLAGKVEPDPQTGRLTATFDENPQQPFEDFKLHFFGGSGGSLRTPATCGNYSTTSSLTPWSFPDSGPPATPQDNWAIAQGANGAACINEESQEPNAPSLDAGAVAPIAGAYSPLVVTLRREDGSQQFSAVTVTPPPGLVGKLAGIPACPDSALQAAAGKTGAQEQANPSCPAASLVGSVDVAAGAGPAPYHAPGKVYLGGSYKGAPISLAIVTPATAGPFDLGTVVVKTALYVDSKTAQITAVADPIPSILSGIPLDVRSAQIKLDRHEFSLNPTSCDPMSFTGRLTSTLGQTASLSNRFQLGECTRLGLAPKLSLTLKGGTKRRAHPALTATLEPGAGNANLASVSVALPATELLDNAHIGTVCTRVQFAASECPADSIYGTATVTTPLLDAPLTGNVYLRSSDNPLPDLVPDLRGPASQPIRLESAGRTDTVKGALRNTFDLIPDAPFTKLVLSLPGGKRGLIQNSSDICAKKYRATIKYVGHNGSSLEQRPAVKADCPKKPRKKHRRHHHRAHRRVTG